MVRLGQFSPGNGWVSAQKKHRFALQYDCKK